MGVLIGLWALLGVAMVFFSFQRIFCPTGTPYKSKNPYGYAEAL